MKKLVKLAVASAVVFGASSAMAVEPLPAVVQIDMEAETCTVLDKEVGTYDLIQKEVTVAEDETALGHYENTLENNHIVWCKTIIATGTKRKAEKYNADNVSEVTEATGTDPVCEVIRPNGNSVVTGIFKNVITPSGTSTLTCTFSLGDEPLTVVEEEEEEEEEEGEE